MTADSKTKKHFHKRARVYTILGLLSVLGAGWSIFSSDFKSNISPGSNYTFSWNEANQDVTMPLADQLVIDRVKLELLGVVTQGGNSLAFISINDGSTIIVEKGGAITPGLLLEDINSKNIIVRHTQELERVALQSSHNDQVKKHDSNVLDDIQTETLNKEKIFRVGNEQLGLAQAPESIQQLSDNQYIVRRSYLTSLLNTPDIFKQALIKPKDGGGLIFGGIRPDSVFDYLGFRIGDEISEVNGKSVDSLWDVLAIRNDYENISKLEVKISRGNNSQYLHYFLQ
ncbi:MAG: hypothetical protein OQK46_05780 [Gammaproteobacteria bacterium]|nr:hypothetical protein [Gammaproteobacteria bacterium]